MISLRGWLQQRFCLRVRLSLRGERERCEECKRRIGRFGLYHKFIDHDCLEWWYTGEICCHECFPYVSWGDIDCKEEAA
ncbi:MAG: hypothetical protein MPK62_00670 [Alphaproteobacteria bacterium]|nr:hypothetical protein [Alphaproteobacteria bacterium]MDA8029651.1 hypothetical protein [Alphaproteobacteria bacterium]